MSLAPRRIYQVWMRICTPAVLASLSGPFGVARPATRRVGRPCGDSGSERFKRRLCELGLEGHQVETGTRLFFCFSFARATRRINVRC